jgi:hypothetical protein
MRLLRRTRCTRARRSGRRLGGHGRVEGGGDGEEAGEVVAEMMLVALREHARRGGLEPVQEEVGLVDVANDRFEGGGHAGGVEAAGEPVRLQSLGEGW